MDERPCGWNLIPVTEVDPTRIQPPPVVLPPRCCPNGHPVSVGDYLCPVCSVEIPEIEGQSQPLVSPDSEPQDPLPPLQLNGWRSVERIDAPGTVRERHIVEREGDRFRALLTLYLQGAEPDPNVYEVLQRMDLDHIPEVIEFGHWEGRPYEISEYITGGSLADLSVEPGENDVIRTIIDEVGRALYDFACVGLRHRNLQPDVILIRDPDSLDLVIHGFGSARLSEFDLDLVSPLETTRYMAPEAVLGGVASASDWWSLGMILLEKLTGGACFEGVNERAFLIHALTNGVVIPEGLDPEIHLLLRGLLVRERTQRWQWNEVKAWLEGNPVELPERPTTPETDDTSAIELGGAPYWRLSAYALAAAAAESWDEALDQFMRGHLVGWAEEIGLDPRRLSRLRTLQARELEDDIRLSLALKLLNPDMPLIIRGDIITPGWLTQNAEAAYAMITGEAPDILLELDTEAWLSQLKRRAQAVRARGKHHEVELNEPELRVYLLSTSRAVLGALWKEKRKLFPDTDHRGLAAIMDRRQLADEDLIILLSAASSQFRSVDEIVDESHDLAKAEDVRGFDQDQVKSLLAQHSRREIFRLVADRVADFARCGNLRIDEWADEFRHHPTLISRALVILSIPQTSWQKPARQRYVSDVISFFEQKVATSIKRGALARMTIGRTSRKIDILELNTPRRPAEAMLNAIIDRSNRPIDLDPAIFAEDPVLEVRLRGLHQHSALYKRDTGIDGLFIGFPFLIFRPIGSTMLPRISPVLLWPVRFHAEVGRRGVFSFSFDDEREEVRVNPALEAFLGPEATEIWRETARDALGRQARIEDIMDELGRSAPPRQRELTRLPGTDVKVDPGPGELVCSAVLFHVAFMAQATIEDLRHLRQRSPSNTALGTMMRIEEEEIEDEDRAVVRETNRYFTVASDPSQEQAVLRARTGRGLMIEGPPGTGKSQTIVNIVADAIGRKKSLLLVCQKHAALEVVRKRLEAEGLGVRIMMVTDVNKDRSLVVRSIREQVEALSESGNFNRLGNERKRLGSRIEVLEEELGSHHQALHQVDPVTGRSYRDLVSELVDLETQLPIIDCLQVRQLVARFDIERLTSVEEACAPLGRDWLAADYEGSPLEALRMFGWDESVIAGFTLDFESFREVESKRAPFVTEAPAPFALEEVPDEEIDEWIKTAQIATAAVSFLGRLSLPRFLRRRRLRAFLSQFVKEPSEATMQWFHRAAHDEKRVRPSRTARRNASLTALRQLDQWFGSDWVTSARKVILANKSNKKSLYDIKRALPTLASYQRFRTRSRTLVEETWSLFAALRVVAPELQKLESGEIDSAIRRIIRREARLAWKSRMEEASPVLLIERSQIETSVTALAEADHAMRGLNRQLLVADIDRSKLGSRQKWKDITRLTGPRMIRLREFVDRGADLGLFEVRPVWLMNPDVASRLLPLNRGMFDIVVYDEASQIPVEYALPTLYRGKLVIVSGDEKQLPPTSFFTSRIESDEAEIFEGIELDDDATEEEIEAAEETWNRREIKDCPDLLALARAALPNTMLEVHYRSAYRELIAYSNAAFYSNRLNVPARHPDDQVRTVKPIEVIRVDGVYEAQTNPAEASCVVEFLKSYWQKRERETIGVVTFNRKQAALIEERLEACAEEDDKFQNVYSQELNRFENGEDMGFFVKNVENVQGDERDIIIFSTTFGRNAQGTFRRNFGVLGQKGGQRRLNVAISRARKKVVLLTSMPVTEVSDMIFARRPPTTPRDYLQGYLHFAELMSAGELTAARNVLRQVVINQPVEEHADGAVSDGFAQIVAAYIQELGYDPIPAQDGTAFGIDFAIRDPRNGSFGIGIECDAPRHPILASARAREIWRPKVLAHSIPAVHRVSSYGWYHDRKTEKRRLWQAIEAVLS